MKTFLSYGGGVQSTAMVLMALDPEHSLKRPDYIVFADTGSEMPETYEVVREIEELCKGEDQPFITVKAKKALHEAYQEKNAIPVVGIRSCTSTFKIDPIKRFMRTIVGHGRGKVIAQSWIGITTDEIHRARPSTDKWSERKYPLLDLDLSRDSCKHYLKERGWKVQKSGCFLCPYQSGHQWSLLNLKHPDLFKIALGMEKATKEHRGFRGGLWGSKRSIEAFNASHTLEDFGFEMGASSCDPGGGCFL